MLLGNEEAKIIPNMLSREMCEKIIANADNWEYDILKRDLVKQDPTFDKATLDKNTIEKGYDDSFRIRKVAQSPMKPVFEEWDNNPVYRCKVMKYEEGEFVTEHRDAQWMCLSNYWVPNTNKVSQSLIVIPLNDDYEGGEFTVEGKIVPQEVGSAIQINCNPMKPEISPKHGVTEVTKGTRYSLVFWNFS
tara:strand:+ start:10037 stop:10606 length:570 start_codon:yes stop_codon:yes gene_type:complete